MEILSNFKFLKVESMQRKNQNEINNDDDKYFFVLHMLDDENNPCRFFVFNNELKNHIATLGLQALQDVECKLKLQFTNNMWQVNLVYIR